MGPETQVAPGQNQESRPRVAFDLAQNSPDAHPPQAQDDTGAAHLNGDSDSRPQSSDGSTDRQRPSQYRAFPSQYISPPKKSNKPLMRSHSEILSTSRQQDEQDTSGKQPDLSKYDRTKMRHGWEEKYNSEEYLSIAAEVSDTGIPRTLISFGENFS